MDDGLFQLLFFGILILATVFDAMTRKRRRRRRMGEMDHEEKEEAVSSWERESPTAAAERETADSMVPSDLWEILTGEQPDPQGNEPEVSSSDSRALPDWIPEPEPVPEVEPVRKVEPVPEPKPPEPLSPVRTRVTALPPQLTPTPAAVPVAARPREFREAASGGASSNYAELLRSGGADSLRKAIVLREVLGAPAALRPLGWGGEER